MGSKGHTIKQVSVKTLSQLLVSVSLDSLQRLASKSSEMRRRLSVKILIQDPIEYGQACYALCDTSKYKHTVSSSDRRCELSSSLGETDLR